MFKKFGILFILVSIILINANQVMANNTNYNVITDLAVSGNKAIEEQRILDQVKTKVGNEISNEQLREDMKAIYNLGYFSNIQILFKNYKSGVQVVFKVDENPILTKIVIEGNKEVSNDELKALLTVKTGKILNFKDLNQDREAINKYYYDQGFVLGRIVDVKMEEDKLNIIIDEGRLNKIRINPEDDTKDYVIRRQLSMKEGEVFNINDVRKDISKLQRLKYFEEIKPEFEQVPNDPQAIDVKLNLNKPINGRTVFGVKDSAEGGAVGNIMLEKHNMFGKGQKLTLDFEAGSDVTDYNLDFYDPWIFESKTSFNINLYHEMTEESTSISDGGLDSIGSSTRVDRDIKEKGVDMQFGRELSENIRGYLNFGYDDTKIEDDPYENTRSIAMTTIRDLRDNYLHPRSGSRQEFRIEKAGFNGDNDFLKSYLDLRNYFEAGEKSSWAIRMKIGASDGKLPTYKKYKLKPNLLDGVRGYDSSYYGGTDGFKGDSILLGSIEYRVDLYKAVRGVLFTDVGRTFKDNDISLNDLNYSVGVGVRFFVPVLGAELGFDYGYAPEGDADHKDEITFKVGTSF
ncbi:BamA/OMP85 family outer membrane protein [Orenia marismortui]|uniref:Outer membrane protein insertion porin family n=1 Tax=Orenia marismortui TaxID=46469 RepID=A0A4R8GSB0_9FIRM|nr:BamA/TamA family outer membrane protein [Orenia marismortui]TDX48803.1 outer membrane protein insertion porin family [Orenia marismortui]